MTLDVKVSTTSSAKIYVSWTTAPKKPDLKILFRTVIGYMLHEWGKEVWWHFYFIKMCPGPLCFDLENCERNKGWSFSRTYTECKTIVFYYDSKRRETNVVWLSYFQFPLDLFASCPLSHALRSGRVKEKVQSAVNTGSIQIKLALPSWLLVTCLN